VSSVPDPASDARVLATLRCHADREPAILARYQQLIVGQLERLPRAGS
jgi:hypothetical protein